MMRSEAAVTQSGVPWTILRPFGFMSNALRWVDQLREGDVVREPFANVAVAVIDPHDIAAVAASALRDEGHEGNSVRPERSAGAAARRPRRGSSARRSDATCGWKRCRTTTPGRR